MRERSPQGSRSTASGQGGGKLRLRASHRRGNALKISHSRPGSWEPPVKDADREEAVPQQRLASKKR